MIAIDSNVMIAAHRKEHSAHNACYIRLRELAEGDGPWGLPVFCIGEFLRVVTHPKVFAPPSSLEIACSFVDRLLLSPSSRLLLPDVGFWDSMRTIATNADASGNLVFDAQIAAVCRDGGVRQLITLDRDFARFPTIEAVLP